MIWDHWIWGTWEICNVPQEQMVIIKSVFGIGCIQFEIRCHYCSEGNRKDILEVLHIRLKSQGCNFLLHRSTSPTLMGDLNKTGWFCSHHRKAWSQHSNTSKWPGKKSKRFKNIMYIFTEDILPGHQREITQHRTEYQ